MGLNKQQWEFSHALGLLLLHIYSKGYKVSMGDSYAKDGHKDDSFHYERLAQDLNLFDREGNFLTNTEDHLQFGEFWEMLGGTWGGRFKNKDGNHYSWGEK